MELGAYRVEQGLTLDEVGAAVGVKSKGYLSRLESRQATAGIRLALRFQTWSGGKVRAESLVSADDARLLREFGAAFGRPSAPAPAGAAHA